MIASSSNNHKTTETTVPRSATTYLRSVGYDWKQAAGAHLLQAIPLVIAKEMVCPYLHLCLYNVYVHMYLYTFVQPSCEAHKPQPRRQEAEATRRKTTNSQAAKSQEEANSRFAKSKDGSNSISRLQKPKAKAQRRSRKENPRNT